MFRINSLFSVVSKWQQRKLLLKTIDQLNSIENQFTGGVKSFNQNVESLYDCVIKLPLSIQEDFRLFMTQGFFLSTKTSIKASECVSRYLTGVFVDNTLYLDELHAEKAFVDWYSNAESADEFVEGMFSLLYRFVVYKRSINNQLDINEIGMVGKLSEVEIDLFSSHHFKLLVMDFISVYKVILLSHDRRDA